MTEEARQANIPADDTEFELMIAIVDPIQMVRDSGHNPRGWKFDGLPVAPQTRRFRLVRIDYGPELTPIDAVSRPTPRSSHNDSRGVFQIKKRPKRL